MVGKTASVKGVGAAAVLAAAMLALAGCSLPGMSFNGPPKPPKGSSGNFEVQPITPDLLAKQAASRDRAAVGKVNPSLHSAITNYSYEVQPQDVIAVTVWGHPELSSSGRAAAFAGSGGAMPPGGRIGGVAGGAGGAGGSSLSAAAQAPGQAGFTVDTDGTIYFPYVGRVKVAGMTVPEIRETLAKALSKYIVDPQVSVDVVSFNSQTYQLAGSVQRPGLYPITNVPVTVTQAITSAGGILRTVPNVTVASKASATPLADLAHVLYVHDGKREVLDLRSFYDNGDESQDRLLHPGDIVRVPDNTYDQIHLIGEVSEPGDYPLDNGSLNLAEALGRAGGLNLTTSNPSRVFVFRGQYQEPEIFWLDARSPVTMLLATQFQLQPQDVIYVATAGVTTWNRIITQILPTVQALTQIKQLTK